MSAISDPSASSTAWPAARPTGISPIQHPAWEEARNAILDLAAAGPVTAIVVGEPGTGKTWLLYELAASLGDYGFPTMMLTQGDLPMVLSSGAALLVDEASLMDAATRARLSAQQRGVVVLAGAECFMDGSDSAASDAVTIPLRPLQPSEIADFAAEWLGRAGSPAIIDAVALSQLVARTRGRLGVLVPLLREIAASWDQPAVATPEAPPAQPPPPARPQRPAAPPRRHSIYRPILAGAALAATILIGWALIPDPPPAPLAQAPAPTPATADAAPTPSLPSLRYADTPDPALVTASAPTQPSIAGPPLVLAPPPELDAANIPAETELPTPHPVIAAAPPPPVLAPADPVVVATLDDPAATLPDPTPPQRSGGTGLVLVAQRGDTLESLYGSVYRDRHAPPFAWVLAANPGPFKPGTIVVFPEPPGGWQRVQH